MAVALLVTLVIGCVQYVQVYRQYRAMMDHVVVQQNMNVELRENYRSQIDLEQIQEKALALGMIPMSEAEVMTIHPVYPEPEAEAPWWEDISWFLKGLFA